MWFIVWYAKQKERCMKKKSNLRNIIVVSTEKLTPHLQRIVFGGEDLNDFPAGEEGAYVKVMLYPDKDDIDFEKERPKMRSYTVAGFDIDKKELTVDFAINTHHGHTSSWAKNSKIGDTIVIAGPGPRKIYDFPKTDYVLMGDLTSINAVEAYLKLAPKGSTGIAIIGTPDAADKREIIYDNEIKIIWKSYDDGDYYLDELKKYEGLSEKSILFASGEATQVASVRKYLKENSLNPIVYMSGYWKKGRTDEQYRQEKHAEKKA